MTDLIKKYNKPGPRYTSYPAVPHWETESFSAEGWVTALKKDYFDSKKNIEGLSLYIHLPFCESLCTFCGCNKRITKNHDNEDPYIQAILKEWSLYTQLFGEKPLLKEIHLGGGTPTFFSAKNLEKLIQGIVSESRLADNYAFSFEGHPNNTTEQHLKTLYDLGFTRVSFGVQDYNETVQKAIHRIQPFENVKKVTETARKIGYTSVGHDIIFGLPFQNMEHIEYTLQKTRELAPDRIAFYSYAHVPWIKGNGQRGFKEEDIPKDEAKRQLYERGKKILCENGYVEIGMDHFALPHDSLHQSMRNKTLHRNFMGYTSSYSPIMIGLGVSSISNCKTAFAQNEKNLEDYYQALKENRFPVFKGHFQTKLDIEVSKIILDLTCRFTTKINPDTFDSDALFNIFKGLEELKNDGIVEIENNQVTVTDIGRPFIRNVCMAFDPRLHAPQTQKQQFSMTV
ncbi:MAG TPA: oxygen-independent coproporphyrinogen III oxidase [Flavobacteriaceae bacterium]|nr:oxygen-independent coproporphyrinogen III oxidase [Flavobacteriaceae bacterium]